jgi:molybdenum cofactor cytidylyltransferase
VLEACLAVVDDGPPPIRVAPFLPRRAGLIQTRLPGLKPSVIAGTVAVTRTRLAQIGAELAAEAVFDHDPAAVEAAITEQRAQGCEPILILGASAIVDRNDVLPAAIVASGGEILHFGMPVDPGNLLLMGRVGATHVIGLPGCARSPKLNGFDRVLQRLAAGIEVLPEDIMRMGAGGLLTEIAQRPLPRAAAAPVPMLAPDAAKIAAVVLAAGRSSRMGGPNKLLSDVIGGRMIARVVRSALGSSARPVIVVLGHDAAAVREALIGLPVTFVDNPDHAQGLSTSLKAGIAALPDDSDAALVLLGDMPKVSSAHLDRLIAAFNPDEGREICVPTYRAKRGNPVLWARRFFAEMMALEGDTGARTLIGTHAEVVGEVEMGDDGVLIDVDTPDALAALLSPA